MTEDEIRNLPPMVSFRRAAKALGIGQTKAYELKKNAEFPLPLKQIGKRDMVPRSALLEHLGIAA